MKLTDELKALLDGEVKRAVKDTLDAKGLVQEKPKKLTEAAKPSKVEMLTNVARTAIAAIKEGFVLVPKAHMIKTEGLSDATKAAHDKLYK